MIWIATAMGRVFEVRRWVMENISGDSHAQAHITQAFMHHLVATLSPCCQKLSTQRLVMTATLFAYSFVKTLHRLLIVDRQG